MWRAGAASKPGEHGIGDAGEDDCLMSAQPGEV